MGPTATGAAPLAGSPEAPRFAMHWFFNRVLLVPGTIDATGRIRNGLQALYADRASTLLANSVRSCLDPPNRCFYLLK
jgi:hypothetical protein